MFDDKRKKVDLRGKSKNDDRKAVLARAAKEREERAQVRLRLTAALTLQAAARSWRSTHQLNTALRAAFDERIAGLDAATFAGHAPHLISLLLRFHRHAEPSDAGRRGQLLALLLQSAAQPGLETNACARTLSEDGSPADRWLHQMRRLAELCLPHLLDGGSSAAASVPTVELRALSYLLDASAWKWAALLPAAIQAGLPAFATAIALSAAKRDLFARSTVALRCLLPPPSGSSPSSLVAPLLALVVRGLYAACSGGDPPSAADGTSTPPACPPPAVAMLARELLCEPTLLTHVPSPLMSLLFAPALVPIVKALAPHARQLLATVTPPSPPGAAPAVVAQAQAGVGSLRLGHFGANLALLLSSAAAGRGGGSAIVAVLGDALPSYLTLLFACHPSLARALSLPKPKRPRARAPSAACAWSS